MADEVGVRGRGPATQAQGAEAAREEAEQHQGGDGEAHDLDGRKTVVAMTPGNLPTNQLASYYNDCCDELHTQQL